jgi:hypothetical protein
MGTYDDTLKRYRQALRDYFTARKGSDTPKKHAASRKMATFSEEAKEKLTAAELERWLTERQKVRSEEFPGRRQTQGIGQIFQCLDQAGLFAVTIEDPWGDKLPHDEYKAWDLYKEIPLKELSRIGFDANAAKRDIEKKGFYLFQAEEQSPEIS